MKAVILLVISMVFASVDCTASQSTQPIAGTDQVSVRYRGGSELVEVPIQIARNVPLVSVRLVGHSGPYSFAVDTGSSYTLLDAGVVRKLGLRPSEKASISGAGSGRVEVGLIPNISLMVGELQSSGHKVVILDLKGLSQQLGHSVDGILGYDLLSKAILTLDYFGRRARFQSPKNFTPPKATEVLPIRLERRWIYVPLRVKVPGGEEFEDYFFVDTGSGDEVNHPAIKTSTGSLRRTQTGVGIGQATEGVIGILEHVRIGRFQLQQVTSSCCGANPATNAQIGSGFLKHFVVTFDYANRLMYVKAVDILD